MSVKRHFSYASALGGTMSIFAAAPASAACITTVSGGTTTVNCDGATATQLIGDNVDVLNATGNIWTNGSALLIGSNFGQFNNNAHIRSDDMGMFAVDIAEMRDGGLFDNLAGGTLSSAGTALRISGPGNVRNAGLIEGRTGSSTGIQVGASSVVDNLAGGTIRGGIAIRTGFAGRVTNAGTIEGHVQLGQGSRLVNSGSITSTAFGGVNIDSSGIVENLAGGTISVTGLAPAVSLRAGSNRLVNAGTIDSTGASIDARPIVVLLGSSANAGFSSDLINSGTLGHSGFQGYAIYGGAFTSGERRVSNTGTIHGDITLDDSDYSQTLYNGYDLADTALAGANEIHGDILLGRGNDYVRNNGDIYGNIDLGLGNDFIDSAKGSTIDGHVLLGGGSNFASFNGAVLGDISAGDGNDRIHFADRVAGTISLGGGDDILRITNDDNVLVYGGGTIQGGEGEDSLRFTDGEMGIWTAATFNGFETLSVLNAAVALRGDFEAFEQGILVENGLLWLDDGGDLEADVLRGNVTVQGSSGEFRLDGVLYGNVNVRQGATLSGAGSVGSAGMLAPDTPYLVSNDGVVTPDSLNNVGTLEIFGNFEQTANGLLQIELNAESNDLLSVSGTAALNGAVQFIPLQLVSGSYTFLTAQGGVTGQFATLNPDETSAQGNFYTYALNYANPNQVSVTVTTRSAPPPPPPPPPGTPAATGLTANQLAVYRALATSQALSSDLAAVRTGLNGLGAAAFAGALESLGGESHALTAVIATDVGEEFAHTVDRRMRDNRRFAETGAANAFWLQAHGVVADASGDGNGNGYERESKGITLGVDRSFGRLRLGLAGSLVDSKLELEGMESRGDVKSLHLGAYAGAALGRVSLNAQASVGRHDVDTKRTLATGTTDRRTAEGSTDASEWRASAKGGIELGTSGRSIRPVAGLSYGRVSQDGLRETGADDAGLEVGRTKAETLTGAVGLELAALLDRGKARVKPYVDLFVMRDFVQRGLSSRAALIGGGNAFVVEGAERGRTAGRAAIGLTGTIAGAEVRVGYDFETRKRLRSHALGAGLSLRF